MNTYAKQIPQQGANINQQKELSSDTTERLKLKCTTLYHHLGVATPEVATNLLLHMYFTLGLIIYAKKIINNIPTEAPSANLVNVQLPFQCTATGLQVGRLALFATAKP